jgi:perosamine synthetase
MPADPGERIPVCSSSLAGKEAEYLAECVKTGWISSSGPFVKRFEEQFAAWCGVRFGISANSGTSALHLALAALGVGPGDEVIVPSLTIIACANVVVLCGATPVLADVDPETGCISAEAAARCVTARTKAIMPVHLYGFPCNVAALPSRSPAGPIAVVEDAAEAIGTELSGKRAGALGTVGAFSFFANKVVTTGEGGMAVTDDPDRALRLRRFRDQWFVPERRFFHPDIGFSYRISNVQAALGVAQLERVSELVRARIDVAARYRSLFEGLHELELPPEAPRGSMNCHWMYAVRVASRKPGVRDALAAHLAACGIETRTFFIPLHRQPPYRQLPAHCPVSDDWSERGLLLPTGPLLTLGQQERVASEVRRFFRA